jgi:hypothetical protein
MASFIIEASGIFLALAGIGITFMLGGWRKIAYCWMGLAGCWLVASPLLWVYYIKAPGTSGVIGANQRLVLSSEAGMGEYDNFGSPAAPPLVQGIANGMGRRVVAVEWGDSCHETYMLVRPDPSHNSGLWSAALYGAMLTIKLVSDELNVSSQITDRTGESIAAEIDDNEWTNKRPDWEINHTPDTVEVRDDRNRIVLQVKLLPDHVQLAGEWWRRSEDGTISGIRTGRYWHPCPDGGDHCSFTQKLSPTYDPEEPRIEPKFDYSGELNRGQRPLRAIPPSITAPQFDGHQKGLFVVTPITMIEFEDPKKPKGIVAMSVIGDDAGKRCIELQGQIAAPSDYSVLSWFGAIYAVLILSVPLVLGVRSLMEAP